MYEIPYDEIANPYVVTLLIASEEKSRIFQLLERENGVLINQAGRSYFVPNTTLEDLTPS